MKLLAAALVVYISIIFSPSYCAQEAQQDSDAALALVAFSTALEQEKANEWQVIQIFRNTMYNVKGNRRYEPLILAIINFQGNTSSLKHIIRMERNTLRVRPPKVSLNETNFERALANAFRSREQTVKKKRLIAFKRGLAPLNLTI